MTWILIGLAVGLVLAGSWWMTRAIHNYRVWREIRKKSEKLLAE